MSTITPDTIGPDSGEHPAIPDEPEIRLDPATMGTRSGATDLEPVTGPLPVVDLDDGHVHVTTRREVTIIALDGGLDGTLADQVVDTVAGLVADASAVIVDLDHLTLLDRSALEAVCAVLERLPESTRRCLVAGRLSTRMVLERWDILDRFVLFHTVADALQAREFVASGYGTGWQLER
jgi:anti-anti-sigma regulatory factor